jgi:uncharacterized membrane protein YdfJ with MMPL/SSD domain
MWTENVATLAGVARTKILVYSTLINAATDVVWLYAFESFSCARTAEDRTVKMGRNPQRRLKVVAKISPVWPQTPKGVASKTFCLQAVLLRLLVSNIKKELETWAAFSSSDIATAWYSEDPSRNF